MLLLKRKVLGSKASFRAQGKYKNRHERGRDRESRRGIADWTKTDTEGCPGERTGAPGGDKSYLAATACTQVKPVAKKFLDVDWIPNRSRRGETRGAWS